ncbi:MAG: hypothetical protein DDG59_15225 [Anaerolineae bacterium]|jgi:flavin-dependent dehydrogenase|nr:MAG: hypothetical protein DDG59_15225 [Anaerolineae bacterium]
MHYDVIIIGAGPAGLSTALHLLRHSPEWGERLLVLEKAVHPRFKLCGGAVTRLGLETLRGLDFPLPLPLEQFFVKEVRLKYQRHMVTLPGKPQLVIFNRADLDAYLAQQAKARGIQLREGEEVKEITISSNGVSLCTPQAQYFAQVVVGADGANGITRRYTRHKTAKARLARTLEVLQAAPKAPSLLQDAAALFDFSLLKEGLQGYVWDFPFYQQNAVALNRGIYDARLDRSKPLPPLPNLFRAAFSDSQSAVHPPWRSHPIHWFSPRNRFAYPRLLLVGEVAGVDPLFGEGIGPALAYGQVAAQAITEAFERQDFSFSTYRARLRNSYLGRYLMTRWFTAEVSYRLAGQGWFPPLVWHLGKLLAGLFPPPDLFLPPQG